MEHRQERRELLDEELKRLVVDLETKGAQRILPFGSMAQEKEGLESDIGLTAILQATCPLSRGWSGSIGN